MLRWDSTTPLLGSLPELASMAVIAVIQSVGERFDVEVADDDIDGSSFAAAGTVVDFVRRLASE